MGTNAAEEIRALAGNDDVAAQYGNDTVNGDKGNDVVNGLGNDTVYGGPDGDGSAYGTRFDVNTLEGKEESDTVYGGGAPTILTPPFQTYPWSTSMRSR